MTPPMDDAIYMERCFELARRGAGHTAPNPMVGAVLVHDGRIIGEGWHHHYGANHAEVNCLLHVQDADRHLIPQSTMYVNLEPCAHYGITPPCSLRLVEERVARVVIANCDPFEKVSGRGVEILRNGGVAVETGMKEAAGYWLNRRFFRFHKSQRPYIILKWAQTAEGFIAPTDRKPFRITGDTSQLLNHKWRTEETAIMAGTNTALCDDPRLTARKWQGPQPLRIVIDRLLKIPHDFHLYDESAATWIVNETTEGQTGNIHYIQSEFGPALIPALMHRMAQERVLSVIVEGGAMLLNQFIATGNWDEARVLTGAASLPSGLPAPVLQDALRILDTAVGRDQLRVYVHSANEFYHPSVEPVFL